MAHDGRDLDGPLRHTARAYLVKDRDGTMHVALQETGSDSGGRQQVVTGCEETLPASPYMGVHGLESMWRYADPCEDCKGTIKRRRGVDPAQPDWDADLEPSLGFRTPITAVSDR